MDVENHFVYSDKFDLRVIDLTSINMATKEDKAYEIDKWASFFKATTWEDLKMLAQENKYLTSATETIYKLSADEQIRLQCEAREEYYRVQKGREELLAKQDETIAKQDETIAKQDEAIAQKDKTIAKQDETIAKLQAKILELEKNQKTSK